MHLLLLVVNDITIMWVTCIHMNLCIKGDTTSPKDIVCNGSRAIYVVVKQQRIAIKKVYTS